MGAQGFWDDGERAASVSGEHARASKRLASFQALERDVQDLDALVEMASEEPSLQEEVDEQIASVEERLAAVEEQRLFSGAHDAGDALVSVNAGAGGTDAQDWAEMVLRMEMRWAERRGFGVELLEVSPGEEAGIKSATFRASGENAYGLFAAERGVHRLVRLAAFDAAHRRQTSFAGVEVGTGVGAAGGVGGGEGELAGHTPHGCSRPTPPGRGGATWSACSRAIWTCPPALPCWPRRLGIARDGRSARAGGAGAAGGRRRGRRDARGGRARRCERARTD